MRGRINIDKNGALFKAFDWCMRLIIAFSDGNYSRQDYETKGTDLCHFIRTFVITVPFIILLEIAAVVMPTLALFVMPAYWFGIGGLEHFVGAYVLVALAILACYGIAVWSNRKKKEVGHKDPTVLGLLGSYISAKKQRVCPLIEWREE